MIDEVFVSEVANERLDKVLAKRYCECVSRVRVQEAIENGGVLVNGNVVQKRHVLGLGDLVSVVVADRGESTLKPNGLPLDVLFDDEHFVAVNKPHGQTVHPGVGTGDDTLTHALLAYCNLSAAAGNLRPGVVHRLDKDTSGVIIFAKTDRAYFAMTKLFAERNVGKVYFAVVRGVPALCAGTIDAPIGRSDHNRTSMCVKTGGRAAITSWEVVEAFEDAALLRCQIHTGRTHQIRVHLKHIGHPIVGDVKYNKASSHCRLLLHAGVLEFVHPFTSEAISIRAKVPAEFYNYRRA